MAPGGKASRRLVDGLFVPLLYDLSTPAADRLGDAARLAVDGAELAITTDSFVVTPLRFPGGSIGELAVNGTVNDLAVSGATPVAIVTSFLLEAGLPTSELEAEVRAMADAARRAGVAIVGGDTKVVEHGKTDRMYITTTGLGRRMPGCRSRAASVRPGDKVLLSGPVGDHGVTILLARGELDLEADLRSDTRPCCRSSRRSRRSRAPASAGCGIPPAAASPPSLNELALECGFAVHLEEESIPVRDQVRGACELLGLDPLHIANEGQFLAVVAPELADRGARRAARGARRRRGGADRRGARSSRPAAVLVDDPLRRKPDRGHARRRSAAQDLLGGRWRSPSAHSPVQVEEQTAARGIASSSASSSGGAASRTRVPRDVGAFPARRPPHRLRSRPVRNRRAARVRRVRAPRHRRQARAPGARSLARLRAVARGAGAAGRHGDGLRSARGRSRRGRGARAAPRRAAP